LINIPSLEIKQIVASELAWKYSVLPKAVLENKVVFYISNRSNEKEVCLILKSLLKRNIELVQVKHEDITEALHEAYRRHNSSGSIPGVKLGSETFIEDLIQEAFLMESSDIHIEISEEAARIRFRIDGVLIEKYAINRSQYPSIVNQIKIKANLNISEKRLPQDGRISIKNSNFQTDLRVSVLPTLYGEKIVLRILSKDATNIDLESLGMGSKQFSDYLQAIKSPHGIILISGPTGSGKTTTLYATLKLLNSPTNNIITIEDPIEYTLEGINQVQLRESIGLDFDAAVRTFLRQDPDVIMLGEIRDGETANMAVRAALTGHLVFSTIHTNSAWGIMTRLNDMGVPSYLLANTVNMVLAQRLIRKLCTTCKKKSEKEIEWPLNFDPPRKVLEHFNPVGCPECHQTGFRGRLAVYEIIPLTRELQIMIREQQFEIDDYLKKKKIDKLSESAFKLIENGQTSAEEAMAVVMSDVK